MTEAMRDPSAALIDHRPPVCTTQVPRSPSSPLVPTPTPTTPPPRSPSNAIGQFLKRIRTRSKSPAPAKKASSRLEHQAWSSGEGAETRKENINHVDHSHEHPVPRAISHDTGFSAATHTQTQQQQRPRSSSRSRLKQWLTNSSSSYATTDSAPPRSPPTPTHHNKIGSWIESKFSRGPSGRRRQGGMDMVGSLREQSQRGALSEEDLVSKSLASDMLSQAVSAEPQQQPQMNSSVLGSFGPPLTSYHSQDSVFDSPQRLPSYIRVSCALNGYRTFRPSAPISPLSPNAHMYLSPGALGLSGATGASPKGKSLVERRLEKFRPPLANGIQTAERHDIPNVTHGIPNGDVNNGDVVLVKKLVSEFDKLKTDSVVSPTSSTNHRNSTAQHSSQRPTRSPPPIPINATTNNSYSNTHSVATGASTFPDGDGDGSLLAEVLKATEQLMENGGVSEGSEKGEGEEEEERAGEKYLRLADVERSRLEEQIAKATVELDSDIPPQGEDAIRTACGKARLLLSKKFKKLEELSAKNLNPIPDDPCPALDSDLDGYWELVMMEVEDVDSYFTAVWSSKASNWEIAQSQQNGKSPPRSNKAELRWGMNGEQSKKPAAANTSVQQNEVRERLKAAKLAAKKRMLESKANKTENTDDIQIFVSK